MTEESPSGRGGKNRLAIISAVAGVMSAVAALVAAILSGYVSYYASVLEANLSEKQIQTQRDIEFLKDATRRQLSERESSFKRAELFTKSIKELQDDNTSSLALLGLWPLYASPEERRIIVAAALHVGKQDTLQALLQLGTELDPYLETVIADAVRSRNATVAENARTVIDAVRDQRSRKVQTLEELLAPMVTALETTEAAIATYPEQDTVAAEKALLDGNTEVRRLLKTHSTLIPPDLKPDAERLTRHYDDWLEEYDRLRRGKEPDSGTPVFAPKHPFPTESARRFEQRYCRLRTDLHGGPTDEDIDAIQIRQVPSKLGKTSDSDREWTRLSFSVHVNRESQQCILDWIDRVVYIMDERWWRSGNEFIRHDRSDSFEFSTRVWGVTQVKVRIHVPNRAPIFREGYMNLREISYFTAPEVTG